MSRADYSEFMREIDRLGAAFGVTKISDDMLKAYWSTLEYIQVSKLKEAVTRMIDDDTGRFKRLPTPADCKRMCRGVSSAVKEENMTVDQIQNRIDIINYYIATKNKNADEKPRLRDSNIWKREMADLQKHHAYYERMIQRALGRRIE